MTDENGKPGDGSGTVVIPPALEALIQQLVRDGLSPQDASEKAWQIVAEEARAVREDSYPSRKK